MNTDVYDQQANVFYPPSSEDMDTQPLLDEDANTRAMLQSLGLHVSLPDPSLATYLPDYQYWPRQTYDAMSPSAFLNTSAAGTSGGDSSMVAAPFTFNQNDLAPQFVQGVHYPILDPSSLFPVHSPNVPQDHPAPDQRRGT